VNSSKPFRLNLLGAPSLTGPDGTPLTGPAVQRHRLALLALLVSSTRGASTRDRLMGYLWPESDNDHARQLLNQAVYQLRRALGERAIVSSGDELRFNTDAIEADVVAFESKLAAGDAAGAVALYRGPLLEGFFVNDAPELEQRIEQERQRLAGLYAGALEKLAETAEGGQDWAGASRWWKTRAAHDPYDSRVALRLMRALDGAGNRAGAIQHAAAHSRRLQEEFGIEPPADIAALGERLRERAAPAAQAPPEGSGANPAEPSASVRAPEVVTPRATAATTPATATTTRAPPRLRLPLLLLGAAVFVAVLYPTSSRVRAERWLLGDAIPRIEEHLAVADWESAFGLMREAERRAPGHPQVAELWPRVSWQVTLHSEPAGATVFRQAYAGELDTWELLGHTPLEDIRIPYGLSRIRLELEGYQPLVRALGGAHINWRQLEPGYDPDMLLVGPELYRLDTDTSLPRGMVRVPGGTISVEGDPVELRDFFLGRFEVTNAEYRAFVEAGGYRRAELWDPVVVKGETIPWRLAVSQFVDRTGRPGPSTWEGGDPGRGREDLPVSGVSWYEAVAYARFAGRELPTAHHWQHALANAMFPWLLPASNFSGEAARAVHAGRAMTHVGAYDMLGNVREWTATAIGDERIILGGGWNDPHYIAGTADASAPPLDRSVGNGIRLAVTHDDAAAARLRAAATRTTAPATAELPPASDEVYAAYGRAFQYDRGELNAAIEAIDTTRMWIRERISLGAGYGSERMLLHLYRPTSGTAPHQVVVYWPGWDTFALDDVDEYFAKQVDFIVASGRAVAFPLYRGTFSRRDGPLRRRPAFGTAEYRDNTIYTVKELRRTVDYLETRRDMDAQALAFFGYSWGGVNGPVALAQEPRLRAAVIQIGLLPPMSATPEVDPLHSLPRVRVPTLLFSGEFDPMVPTANSRRYFDLIGTPAAHKRHVVAVGGHFIPRQLVIRETLEWLDRYLGPVNR
jgi:eukaryotic-like serine/threonine-protein kinase